MKKPIDTDTKTDSKSSIKFITLNILILMPTLKNKMNTYLI
jgi:hypothetical protein